MPDPAEVIIAGAGPAGSATALRLARLGHAVRLIDREPFPRDKACAEYLTPATLRHLARLGLDQAFPSDAPILATHVIAARGSRLTGHFGAPATTGQAIPRRLLDLALVRAAEAAGARLEYGRVVDLIETPDGIGGVVIERADGLRETQPARVTVGADGLRSVVARRAGLRRQGALRRMAFTAHLRGVAGLTTTTEMHVGERGYVGINRLGEDLANVSVVVTPEWAVAARGHPVAFFRAALDAFPALRERMAGATIVRDVLATGPFDVTCRRATGDGVLLVGDAAEFFDPFTGDGIHSALAGAELAAGVLHEALVRPGPVRAARLRGYRMRRLRQFGGTRLVERLIGYAMLSPALFDRAVSRMHRRGMGDLLVGATGHEVPAWRVLNPVALARMLA